MTKIFSHLIIIILCAVVMFVCACKNTTVSSIEREDRFSLNIGPLEDQIALYRLDGNRGIRSTGFAMRDGLFTIADGNGAKIVRYNTYGDLIFMIYNEETNPPPITLPVNVSENEQVTRWAHSYPMEEPGWITVDSRRHIYAEDRIPRQERIQDPESRTLLDGIILHFDQNGRFVNYLGREGIGGSPFPRIIGLVSSIRDELAVICRIPDGWDIYWFSSSGMLLYLVKISSSMLPAHPDWPAQTADEQIQSHTMAEVDAIFAAPDERFLYIKVDYTKDTIDQSTNTRTGSEPVGSCIWTLNVEDGTYLNPVDIPLYEIIENGRPSDFKVFYFILGAARNGKLLMYFPVETGYALLFADIHSRGQRRGSIWFSNEELGYNDFYLSPEGILCAMLADSVNLKMVWWRTDNIMGDMP
ncbi:MAG: hypothetical protein FWB83_00645 [Treponema sp.]|nr:hypothetical protein [Treponema sp.]